jgi:1-acyl-sn-glycerol-3-phosphate acyltransferase
MTGPEPWRSRWRRRARTVPLMLFATALAIMLLPVLAAVAAVLDVARGRWRLPTVRVLLFLVQYAINDSVEIVLAGPYWMLAGFGRRLGSAASIARHERLQAWSIGVLARRAERLLGVRIELDEASAAALLPAPAVVLCRHVNLLDASLPAWLYLQRGVASRGVIMAELLADPGFDLIYSRTGSVFVPRDDGPEARRLVGGLAGTVDASTVAIIFPEGRLFRPELLARAMERLASSNPERSERLAGLRHVLPPRPGGVLALLDALPGSDVVVVAHTGLDRFASFGELSSTVPLRDPVRVTAWRVPRAAIPGGADARVAWLDAQWHRVDELCHDGLAHHRDT